jgi:hypothetical protein
MLISVAALRAGGAWSSPVWVHCDESCTVADLDALARPGRLPVFAALPFSSHLSIGLRSIGTSYALAQWRGSPPLGEVLVLRCDTLTLIESSALDTSH